MMRLDKYLADLGAGTRSGLKKNIRKNGVQIGGELIRDPGFLVDENVTRQVVFQGEIWKYETVVWYMLNKPAGVLSASEDRKQKTVLDLIREKSEEAGLHVRTDMFPVGRLDRDTEGLLLITNDGQTAHRLLSPKFHVDKTYYVRISGNPFAASDVRAFASGIRFDENLTALPAVLEILGPREARVTIHEGKFHQIRKMIASLGGEPGAGTKSVVYLRRETFGPLTLDEALHPGEFRRLTEEEVALLQAAALGD